jgi:hypothetical protein
MKKIFLFLAFLNIALSVTWAQDNSTKANGNWTSSSTWNNSAPGLSMSWGSLTINHNVTVSGNLSLNISTMNLNGNLSIHGNLTISGSSTINVYGTLEVSGVATFSSKVIVHPGGKLIINESLTVNSNENLVIGSNANPPPYADVVIHKNLNSQSSGDIKIDKNGRLAILGNVTDSGGGGTLFTINSGGQVYIHGNITFTGGGNHIYNYNPANFGLYLNGTVSNTGGGSTVTGNLNDKDDMIANNPDFTAWVGGIPNGPLPLTLINFTAAQQASNTLLQWTTAQEKEFSHFEIERADQTLKFTTIGYEQGKGEAGKQTIYQYVDYTGLHQRMYYRLKMVDLDGSFSYSPVVRVQSHNEIEQVRVYPNPVVGEVFQLGKQPSSGTLTLIDQKGNIIWEELIKDGSEYALPENMQAGVYVLKIQSDAFVQTQRLVIVK